VLSVKNRAARAQMKHDLFRNGGWLPSNRDDLAIGSSYTIFLNRNGHGRTLAMKTKLARVKDFVRRAVRMELDRLASLVMGVSYG
jgi:hypothetical protein